MTESFQVFKAVVPSPVACVAAAVGNGRLAQKDTGDLPGKLAWHWCGVTTNTTCRNQVGCGWLNPTPSMNTDPGERTKAKFEGINPELKDDLLLGQATC